MKPVVFSLKSDPPKETPLELEFSLELDGDDINIFAGPKGKGFAHAQVILCITPKGITRCKGVPEVWFPEGLINVFMMGNPAGSKVLRLLS